MDNIESEALDLILIESLQMHDKSSIYEIDVTQMIIEDLAKYIESVINNNALPQFGRIDWSDVILGWY
jgi:broad-specificity NMP kinase